MTAQAWITTTWGRICETLQPELWALRKEVRRYIEQVQDARGMVIIERQLKKIAQQQAADLSERLAQRTRELKAARAALKRASA